MYCYAAMEVSIAALVHVVLGPLMEALGLNGLVPVVLELVPLELVARSHLEKPVRLLAHMYNFNKNNRNTPLSFFTTTTLRPNISRGLITIHRLGCHNATNSFIDHCLMRFHQISAVSYSNTLGYL